ncbi:hypothetical protein PRCB_17730 [Pantoea rodasii]|uniref:DUF3606 domain-containing protein n=1 Tax=Pantoea rodasii TaxID=1076549 RepID=A0A2M9W995_9GAMM|nr:DUF3606 domain-containing protein [Pantoea rodasii]ORM63999.1 hypothetical protein HA45_12870 [Pantoea rodasii]PJZ04116.1 hypothetical protein PRCB_17730 [Pantoea rodasii]
MKNRDYIQRRVPADLSKIDIRQQWQITFWTLELRTTQERLSRAIREAGPDTGKVREWLEKNPPGIASRG